MIVECALKVLTTNKYTQVLWNEYVYIGILEIQEKKKSSCTERSNSVAKEQKSRWWIADDEQ